MTATDGPKTVACARCRCVLGTQAGGRLVVGPVTFAARVVLTCGGCGKKARWQPRPPRAR